MKRKSRRSLNVLGRWVWVPIFLIGVAGLTAEALAAEALPPLPEGIASFGAAVAGDYLYVYGGHIGQTHEHSVENLSRGFRRLNLGNSGRGWEDLGEVAGLQGVALVAHGGKVYKVGGMTADNHKGAEKEELRSVAEVACYDPETGAWTSLPPLPAPRSSHDAVVVGDLLYVVGGWQLRGADEKAAWSDTMEVLDLSATNPSWRSIPQPFQRRALAAAAAGGKVYALGGLDSVGTSRRADTYDPKVGAWIEGPKLPPLAAYLKGFGVSAFAVEEKVFLSGGDGVVQVLDSGTGEWTSGVGRLETPRFFHRLVHQGDRLVFVAGASSSGHLADLESLDLAGLSASSAAPAEADAVELSAWPGFRGYGDGHTSSTRLPLKWSEKENIAWRVQLPGYGQSAPVVWGKRVFTTSVEGSNKETLILSSLDLDSGEVIWRRRFPASQKIESNEMVSRSAPTPVVDGERLYAFWESGDLLAVSLEGETLWRRSLTEEYGPFTGNHGVGSSLVLTEDAVIVQVTHEGPSYFVAVDRATGENRWRRELPAKVAWTTPTVVRREGRSEVIASGAGRVEGFDGGTGELLWSYEGVEKNNVPSAVVDGDLVVVASSEPGQNFALRLGGSGALNEEQILWRGKGVTSGFGSPLIHGDCVLFVNKAGTVSCLDRQSGEERWKQRLAGSCWASPIASGEYAYFFSKKGKTVVLRPGKDGAEVVAENDLPTDGVVYGVAATQDAILIRTGQELVRVGKPGAMEVHQASTMEERETEGR